MPAIAHQRPASYVVSGTRPGRPPRSHPIGMPPLSFWGTLARSLVPENHSCNRSYPMKLYNAVFSRHRRRLCRGVLTRVRIQTLDTVLGCSSRWSIHQLNNSHLTVGILEQPPSYCPQPSSNMKVDTSDTTAMAPLLPCMSAVAVDEAELEYGSDD